MSQNPTGSAYTKLREAGSFWGSWTAVSMSIGPETGPIVWTRLLPFINQGKSSILQRMFALSNDSGTGRSRDRGRTAVAPVTTANLAALFHCNVAYAIQLAFATRWHGEPKAGATTAYA
jgi:hypothetical protein